MKPRPQDDAAEACVGCALDRHTGTGDCLYTAEAAACSEDMLIEEGLEAHREERHS